MHFDGAQTFTNRELAAREYEHLPVAAAPGMNAATKSAHLRGVPSVFDGVAVTHLSPTLAPGRRGKFSRGHGLFVFDFAPPLPPRGIPRSRDGATRDRRSASAPRPFPARRTLP
jgi:hypothetical protein